MTGVTSAAAASKRRVRVWFGEHPIFDYTSLPAAAERYEHAMRRRFVGLRVTNEPVGERPSPDGRWSR